MSAKPVIAARGVDFTYSSSARSPVVQGWTTDFHAGSVTAITGPSGCGKSTRLYLLALMLKISAGAIEVDGHRVDHLTDRNRALLRAHRFGFVFQDAVLDPTRTVVDNILETALYRGQARKAVHGRALDLMDRFGIAVPPHRRPGQISGGQAQRIALCRALLGRPDILLADEPTGNLDPRSAATVLDAFRDHADAGGCVVVVTHDPAVTRWADRAVALEAAA
ncbi:ABC transporter ATP-binding protein [Georgenia yuyongxinii]